MEGVVEVWHFPCGRCFVNQRASCEHEFTRTDARLVLMFALPGSANGLGLPNRSVFPIFSANRQVFETGVTLCRNTAWPYPTVKNLQAEAHTGCRVSVIRAEILRRDNGPLVYGAVVLRS